MCEGCLGEGAGPNSYYSRFIQHREVTEELAEYLCQVAALLPSNCDGDEECGSEECPACRAFALCRKFREFEGSPT